MTKPIDSLGISIKEIIFQIVLHSLVFVFYSLERGHSHIEVYKFAFFINYALAAFFINYFLLPCFYYRKKTLQFFTYALVTIIVVILIEKLVLGKIYFPDNRGKFFGGVSGNQIYLEGGNTAPMGRAYKEDLLKNLSIKITSLFS